MLLTSTAEAGTNRKLALPFAQTLPFAPQAIFGIVMIQSVVVSFSFVLPTNAPRNMHCCDTGALTTIEFAKVGVVLTWARLSLILLPSATIWPMLGVL